MSLSKSSQEKLKTCHEDIQKVILSASKRIKIQVIEGTRSRERQKELFDKNLSKTMDSKHLSNPSNAVDIAPLTDKNTIEWKDIESFKKLSEIIFEEADKLNVKLIWGGNWKKFKDYVHYERA